MRHLRLLPASVLFLAGALACFGLPSTQGGSETPGGSGPSDDGLVNPAGQRIVDTTIDRTSRAYFPLSEGMELTYDELEFRGAGDRVLFQTERPAGTRVRGQWRFVVTGVDRTATPPVYTATFTRPTPPAKDADTPDDATPVTQELRLWVEGERVRMEGPNGPQEAVTIASGPPVVGSEEVECTLHALGGIRTTCRAIGGIGGDTIGKAGVFLDFKNDWSNAIGRTLVGLATLGTVIPESKRRLWRLERTLSQGVTPERPVPALYRAWTQAPPDDDGVATLRALAATHPPDAASLAAIVSSQPSHVHARAVAAMELLPAGHRAPVIREALRALPGNGYRNRILLLGQLDGSIGSVPRDHRASILGVVGPLLMDSGARLASQACPSFEGALREPESVPWADAVRTHMAGHLAEPACDEAALGVPHDEETGDALLDMVLAAQPEARWGTRLRAAIEATHDDARRVRILDRHQERARQLPEAERRSLVGSFYADDLEDQARAVLALGPRVDGG